MKNENSFDPYQSTQCGKKSCDKVEKYKNRNFNFSGEFDG